MTYAGFIKMLEDCFGPYGSDVYRGLMLRWVTNNLNESALPYLFNRIFTGYSRQFRNCPDARIISDIISEIKKDAETYSDIPQIEKRSEQKLITEKKPNNEEMAQVQGMLKEYGDKVKAKLRNEKEVSK